LVTAPASAPSLTTARAGCILLAVLQKKEAVRVKTALFGAPMSRLFVLRRAVVFTLLVALALSRPSSAQTPSKAPARSPALPSEMPEKFAPVTESFDYVRREVMIPMRDGVKLHTVILVPKGAKGAPILLTRTPYDADKLTSHVPSGHLGPNLYGYDNATEVIVEGGYIRVVQDVRGKHGSEGDYVMNRPLRGTLNATAVDHATDTWDTIDWLVKNVPESNGRVGILGISYDGFLPLMALVNPHPALKVSVRRLVSQRRIPAGRGVVHPRPGGQPQVGHEVVVEPLRRLRHVHGGGLGGRARPAPRA